MLDKNNQITIVHLSRLGFFGYPRHAIRQENVTLSEQHGNEHQLVVHFLFFLKKNRYVDLAADILE